MLKIIFAPGPVLNSGMCTEVFQFEISPTSAANPGAIIPASSVVNASSVHTPCSSHSRKVKNRRILYHRPIPLAGSAPSSTEEHTAESPKDNGFHGNKSISSSMVVSVLIDPREAGDGDGSKVSVSDLCCCASGQCQVCYLLLCSPSERLWSAHCRGLRMR